MGTPVGASSHASGMRQHSSGSVPSAAGDVVIGLYADAGYNTSLTFGVPTAFPLGSKQAPNEAIQGIQSYVIADTGSSTTVTYTSGGSAYGEVAAAAFAAL